MIAAAPTSPVTWVFAPACSATAVREPLVLTGKPWNSPAAMFAAPMPDHLPAPVDLLRRSGPRTPTRSRSCRRATPARCPSAPANSSGEVRQRDARDRERREPLRQRADERDPVLAEVEHAGGDDATARRRRGRPGTRGSSRRSTRISTSPSPPTASAAGDRLAVGDPPHERRRPRRGSRRRRRRTRRAWGAGRPGSSMPARSCSRSSSASRSGPR